jgi:hypothetical protein
MLLAEGICPVQFCNDGYRVRRSKRRESIIDHIKRSPLESAQIIGPHWLVVLQVRYENGDYCSTSFNGLDDCLYWINSRHKWDLVRSDIGEEIHFIRP